MGGKGVVTFLSDYGLEDEFVGVCHAVMLRIAPALKIVDLHHNILRQDIRHGAVVLQQSAPYLPDCVVLGVVDPGVGSERRAIIVEAGNGQVFVGPDNGLFVPVAEACSGIERVVEVTNDEFMLKPMSRTFQGRDLFAPVTAHLASGVDVRDFGSEIPADELVQLEIPSAWIHDDHLHAEVLQIDRFGNLQLNFGIEDLARIDLAHGEMIEVRTEGQRINVLCGSTFTDVAGGEFVLVEDSYNMCSLAINKGDAAERLRARSGSTAIVGPPRR